MSASLNIMIELVAVKGGWNCEQSFILPVTFCIWTFSKIESYIYKGFRKLIRFSWLQANCGIRMDWKRKPSLKA